KTLLAYLDERLEAALEPGRHHDALGVPARAKIVPPPDVAPHRPVVDEFGDGEAVELGGGDGHVCPLGVIARRAQAPRSNLPRRGLLRHARNDSFPRVLLKEQPWQDWTAGSRS